ncbi:thioredoxin family protein [Halorussus salinisoli]|uniref:thioredoxin family protein n=1 Tax=Halorussus salinisoli TaxID=2558242 RepID=UPI0010C2442C|nr:thioredoxin family protein [Halorussus salinisoli]
MGSDQGAELLFSSGILVEAGDTVSLSPSFESSVDDYRGEIADSSREELARLVSEYVDEERVVEPLVRLGEKDPRTVAELRALRDHLNTRSKADELTLLPVLRLFRANDVDTDGSPESFVPVPGDQLPELAVIYSPVLVYVWLDDCPPCDTLKRRLESIFDHTKGVLPLSVYGPDHQAFLAREYDVTAGPAMLFMVDGRVETRLYGAHDTDVITTELGRIRE